MYNFIFKASLPSELSPSKTQVGLSPQPSSPSETWHTSTSLATSFQTAQLTHGRQLESLLLSCHIDCTSTSHIFRSMPKVLPFLRHFSFTVRTVGRRLTGGDPDLFPAIAEFLRGREQLRTLGLVVQNSRLHCSVGFCAAVWGALPSLVNLRTLKISYPTDLAPGLASWLIPRSVGALSLALESTSVSAGSTMPNARDPIPFLECVPSSKVLIYGFSDATFWDVCSRSHSQSPAAQAGVHGLSTKCSSRPRIAMEEYRDLLVMQLHSDLTVAGIMRIQRINVIHHQTNPRYTRCSDNSNRSNSNRNSSITPFFPAAASR